MVPAGGGRRGARVGVRHDHAGAGGAGRLAGLGLGTLQEALRELAGGAYQPGGQPTVVLDGGVASKWGSRFLALGVQGLHDDVRPGQPRAYDARRSPVINRALYA